MIKSIKYASRYFKMPYSQKVAIIKMIFVLTYSTILVKVVPLKYYYRLYIQRFSEEKPCILQPNTEQIRLIRKVINVVPWKVTCLIRSLALRIYFKQIGIHVPIYIGLKSDEQLSAHAWNFNGREEEFCILN